MIFRVKLGTKIVNLLFSNGHLGKFKIKSKIYPKSKYLWLMIYTS